MSTQRGQTMRIYISN